MEDMYVRVVRKFALIIPGTVPDETTFCRFSGSA